MRGASAPRGLSSAAALKDIAFRVISANRQPDHTTIARFRQRHERALAALFGQVLGLCAQAGLADVAVLAVDGTRVHANASERAMRDYQQLAEEALQQATAQGRKKWLEAARRRLDAQREQEARPIPQSRPARVREAKRRLEEELATEVRANDAYEAYRAQVRMKEGRRFGSPPKPYTPPDQPTGRINVTDPDSRTLKTPRGFVQGYNAQAVCNEQQIVVAAEVSVSSADFGQMGPMIEKARVELMAAGVTDTPEVVLADAGYWHGEQIDALMGQGVQVLIPPDADKRRGTRPGWDGGRYAFMRNVLQTDAGGQLYGQRQQMIEPVFADTKFNRRADRFLRRGRAAARAEWRLITATGNLLKLWRHAMAATAA